jgi:hypothetical protein
MNRRRDLIVRRLTEETASTLRFFEALDSNQWEYRIYSEGSQWTVRQILCHFVSAENGFLLLARDILKGGAGAPEDMDIDVFNETEVGAMAQRTPKDLLPEFQQLRAQTIELVSGMREEDFDLEGRHPFFGRSSLEKLLKLVYRHNMLHLRDVRRKLGLDIEGGRG